MGSKGFHSGDYAEKNLHYSPGPVLNEDGAFEAAMERDMQRIYHVALRITRNREDAEDAAQQSMLNCIHTPDAVSRAIFLLDMADTNRH
jgi:hypothetical protein